jgi:Zn-dependent peptidase ImmA (M78 family)/transcriptional regulator with XRE-family HTH domain
MVKSWEDLGKRVQAARKDAGLTQLELAAQLRMERTVVTKIEAGQRTVDSLELAQLARVLRRPIGWFVTDPPASVISRRADREGMIRREDIQLETLAQDVEQLIEIGVLRPVASTPASIESLAAAEQAALDARHAAGLRAEDPAWNLVQLVERLGLYAFVLPLHGDGASQSEGSYISLKQGGVALIGAVGDSGRRRFTIAHELGHHVLADAYAPEWVVGAGVTEREKVINAFAIHFLLPRLAVEHRWAQYKGNVEPRAAAIRIAVEYGLSWSAACAQLQRCGRLSEHQFDDFLRAKPTGFDHAELELSVRSDVEPPLVPPAYKAAVVRALKKAKIGPTRAIELLYGTLDERDLPPEKALSLEAMTSELDVLPE